MLAKLKLVFREVDSSEILKKNTNKKKKLMKNALKEIKSDYLKRNTGLASLLLILELINLQESKLIALPILLAFVQAAPFALSNRIKLSERNWCWIEVANILISTLVLVEAIILPNFPDKAESKLLFLLVFFSHVPEKGLEFYPMVILRLGLNLFSFFRLLPHLSTDHSLFLGCCLALVACLRAAEHSFFVQNQIRSRGLFGELKQRLRLLEFLVLQNKPEQTLVIDLSNMKDKMSAEQAQEAVRSLPDLIRDEYYPRSSKRNPGNRTNEECLLSLNNTIIELDHLNPSQSPEALRKMLFNTKLNKISQKLELNELGHTHFENTIEPLNLLEFVSSLNVKSSPMKASKNFTSKQLGRFFSAKGEFEDGESKIALDLILFEWKLNGDYFVFLKYEDGSLFAENKNLKDFDKFKDRLLATIVHDMRTPLHVILEMNERAKNMREGTCEECSSMIDINAKLLLSMISDLLDYSLFKENRLRLVFTEFSLQKALEESMSLIKLQALHKGLQTKIVNKVNQDTIFSDERRLKQILINLLTNALKFTKIGTISMIAEEVPHLQLIKIQVSDSGAGINPANLSRLFEPFATFDVKDGVNKQGIGLGLFICKIIGSQLGPLNKLSVDSQEGKGSTFSIFIYQDMREIPPSNKDLESLLLKGDSELIKSSSNSSGNSAKKRKNLFQKSYEASGGFEEEAHPGSLNYTRGMSGRNPFFERGSVLENSVSVEGLSSPKLQVIQRSPVAIRNLENQLERRPSPEAGLEKLRVKNETSLDIQAIEVFKFSDKRKLHILIVDDNIFNILVIESQLRKIDFLDIFISKACSGSEAIEKFKTYNTRLVRSFDSDINLENRQIKVIFMDCLMPVMDGWEATRQIKALIKSKAFHSTTVVGLTAMQCSESEKVSCFQAGMDFLFQKPIQYEVIREFLVDHYKD